MSQRPVAIGLLVCEQVIVEENTGNVTLVNCFRRRKVAGFPADPFPFVVFAILTDGSGQITLEVRIERLDTLDEVYQVSHTIRFPDPLQEVRCVIRLRDCSFPVAGPYQVTLLADNEPIAQRRIVLLEENDT
jgi:hypothetical protein